MNKTFLYLVPGAEKDIVGMYEKCVIVKEIAVKYKITPRNVYNVLNKYNVVRGISKRTDIKL